MGVGSWTIIGILLALLGGAVAFAYFGWTLEAGSMPISLIIPMVLGIVFSLVVGIGLMALVFYSSRKGYDEPPREIDRD
jgi:ABC-type multidrug transport system permease subunit